MTADSLSNPIPKELAFPETVCHRTMTGDLAYFPQAEFHGRILFFCTQACLDAFQRDPERFVTAHSRRRMK
jgi:YHS domain-containing protein